MNPRVSGIFTLPILQNIANADARAPEFSMYVESAATSFSENKTNLRVRLNYLDPNLIL
jgi:hypothetical protein